MIIIPEIETVVILVPRTASGSFRRSVKNRYPLAMQIYRHMEADGIPLGYDRWRKIGIVRHPLDRLWSLYKFLKNFDGPHEPTYIQKMRESVDCSFSDYIANNEIVFTSPYCRSGSLRFYPQYNVLHPLPENRKSQFVYLRPDLGTEIYGYEHLRLFLGALNIELAVTANKTDGNPPPQITEAAMDHMQRVFAWDYECHRELSMRGAA